MAARGDTEILDYVHELWPDFSIAQHELDYPSPEFVIAFYQKFYDSIEDINERIHGVRNSSVPSPTAVNKNIYVITLFRYINTFIKKISHAECKFTITDLYDPTAKRTKVRFKVLLNFLIFYQSKFDLVNNCVQKKLEFIEEHKRKLIEKEDGNSALTKQAEELAMLQDRLENLKAQDRQVQNRYETLKSQESENNIKQRKLQNELKTLFETLEAKQKLVANINASLARLNEQLVQEDAYKTQLNLRDSILQKASQLENDWQCVVELLKSRMPNLEHLEALYNKLSELVETSKTLKTLQNSLTTNRIESEALKLKYQEKSKKLGEYTQEILQLKKATEANTELKTSEKLKYEMLVTNIKADIDQINKERERENNELVTCRTSCNKKITELEDELDYLKNTMQELNQIVQDVHTRFIESSNEFISGYYEALKRQAEKYN